MSGPDGDLLAIVRRFADLALERGRGKPGDVLGALFVDGLECRSLAPVRWVRPDGTSFVPVNFASQQHLLRLLVGLSAATGEECYAAAAREAVAEFWRHGVAPGGLWYWGGHATLDRATGQPFTFSGFHELKTHFPFYDWLFAADGRRTRAFVEAFWNAHLRDWTRLDLDRHGEYGQRATGPGVWNHPTELAPVFFTGRGLSFVNTGSDLVFAAAHLHLHAREPGALRWALRLARRYVETRHPDTGIPGYQFSRISGDRGLEQFGPEFGERAHEYDILDRRRAERRFCRAGLAQFQLAERLGPAGAELARWAGEDMASWLDRALDPATHRLWAVLRDGTRLKPDDIRRPGYYTAAGLASWEPDPILLWAVLRASHASRDVRLFRQAVLVSRALGIDGFGGSDARGFANAVRSCDPCLLEALLELGRGTGEPAWFEAARRAGREMAERWERNYRHADGRPGAAFRLGGPLPLALLRAAVAGSNAACAVPEWLPGDIFFTGATLGGRRANDNAEVFSAPAGTASAPPAGGPRCLPPG